jgi:exopolysaccharide production protein ExoZ
MTIKSIQGLRAVAALLVVSVHVGNPDGFESRYLLNAHPFSAGMANIGYIGVDLFFIISGFIMVVTSIGSNGSTLAAGEFLRRRFIRLYPPLWIINTIVLVVFLIKPTLVNSHSAAKPDILASYLLLPQAGSPLLLVAWTLVYEMYFYLVFTVGLLGGKRTLVPTLFVWTISILGMSLAFASSNNVYLAFLGNPIAYEFLLGAIIGALSRRSLPVWAGLSLIAVGTILMVILGAQIEAGQTQLLGGWWRIVTAAVLSLIVLGIVGLDRLKKLSTPLILERIGDSSYAIYLWHIPVLTLLGFALHATHPHSRILQFAGVVLTYAMVIAVGLFIFKYIERPMTRFLRGRSVAFSWRAKVAE